MQKKKRNRQNVQENKRNKMSHEDRTNSGTRQIVEEQRTKREEYKLDWFKPTETQKDIIYSMIQDDLTLVQGSSGCGKSTTIIWQALKDLKAGVYDKIVFVKTPVESTDDGIGFLPSTIDDKLMSHFEASKSIFHNFMSPAKLEMDIKHEKILFKIPNFIQGCTLDNTLLIIEEAQQISPPILKLVMERIGKNGAKVVVLGDKNQQYALKKRPNGFTDFVEKVTDVDEEGRYSKIPTIGYVEMTAKDNMRSDLSKLIVSIYEEE